MNTQRTNKLYNFLVNTYGLSKEAILEHIDIRLNDLIKKHVVAKLDSNQIESVIINHITQYIKDGKFDRWRKDSFKDFVKLCIQEEVQRLVKENYKIEVNLK